MQADMNVNLRSKSAPTENDMNNRPFVSEIPPGKVGGENISQNNKQHQNQHFINNESVVSMQEMNTNSKLETLPEVDQSRGRSSTRNTSAKSSRAVSGRKSRAGDLDSIHKVATKSGQNNDSAQTQ